MSSDAKAKPYKETLNLPSTKFDMKANLTTREPQVQARWREEDLYARLREARKGRPRRVLHDGPPYANGEIHMGHLLNKVLKDFIVRYFSMRGFDSPYVPGWDCHGLPIEHKVVRDLGSKAAQMNAAEIRQKCRVEALKWVDVQRDQFRRLGISGDWENPYLTLNPGYEASILDVLADLVEGGYVFRQLKPIHWCMTDRTALAEAELEYSEETSPSIYVNFPMVSGVPSAWGEGPWHAMIWTTTPWTLPANVAIAAHPDVTYAGIHYVDPESGETLHTLLAADLIGKVMALRGVTEFSEVGRCSGRELEHSQYRHVFLDRVGPVVLADYVTVEDGTGLVHTAPGHGTEDYRTGVKYDLPTISPVDGSGRFTDEAPEWLRGKKVFEANKDVIARLRELKSLYHAFDFSHSYPHCWRCKKPVIFRATDQWFVAVDHDDLRGRTLKIIDESVRWTPSWGESRIGAMVANRPDWCISRQRSWGVPIPAFACDQCGTNHLSAESVRYVRDIFRREGADAWYTKPIDDLLPPGLECSSCGGLTFTRQNDILDVWFESGSSHRAVLEQNFELGYPAYLYLEGSDQHRGWFQSSILTAVGSTGRAPFEGVLTHGFIVDEKGEKMSKSQGNVISAVKSTEQYGADILRLYVASMDYADDIRMSERGLKEIAEAYRKIRNTFRYLLGNLEDYAKSDHSEVEPADLEPIDLWALTRLNAVIGQVLDAYDRYEFYRVFQRIYQFCSVDLSSVYLDILKDRLYAEAAEGPKRRAAQFVMARIHRDLAKLIAPIMPHTAEELWQFVPKSGEPESVHLAVMPDRDSVPLHAKEGLEDWPQLLILRTEIQKKLEKLRVAKTIGSSQEASVEIGSADGAERAFLQSHRDLLAALCIVSEVVVGPSDAAPEGSARIEGQGYWVRASKSSYSKCERCWNLRPSVGQDGDHPSLCDRCARVVKSDR
jgi:isoleucyl-tRNA synthetase